MFLRHAFWIAFGLLTLLLRWAGAAHPEWVERLYSRGLYVPVRWLLDYTIGLLPFPFIYVWVPVVLGWLAVRTWRWWRGPEAWPTKALGTLSGALAFVGGTVAVFLLMWGFNYQRTPVAEHLGLELQPLGKDELWQELTLETEAVLRWRSRITTDTAALAAQHLPPRMEKALRKTLTTQLARHGYRTPGRVRGMMIHPKGIFLRFSSSGLYFPFTGQGHVDAGLHPLQWPPTLAHEMAHGYGFGDEGVCNFWAYVACIRATDPFIVYAGHLSHWRTLAANYQRFDREGYWAWRDGLPPGLRADLDAINENLLAYPDLMPRFRYAAYNSYLKAQGIQEGMMNYNSVIMMVRAWRWEGGEQRNR